MELNLVYFIAGLALLYYGGDWLVDGSSDLAKKYRMRPFIIGAVIIGFGTSAPEAFVSVIAQWKGSSGLAFGNIVGSSIANIGLILGLVALLHPILVEPIVVRREYPFLAFITIIMFALCMSDDLMRWHAAIFLGLFSVFLIWSIRQAVSTKPAEWDLSNVSSVRTMLKIVVGIVGLLVGSELLVRSSTALARHFGISEIVIGTSLVAVGTSLPELASAGIAAARKQSGLALGNLIGSNIFNLLFVSGLALLVRPIPIGMESHQILLPGLLIFTVLLFPIFKFGRFVGKKSGIALLVGYMLFTVFLFAFRQAT